MLRLQRQLAGYKLLIIDELGYVPLSQTGAELLFEVFSQRYERGSTIVTSNLPFDEWTSVFGSERLTGALLDRLTHHVHILRNERRQLQAQSEQAPLQTIATRYVVRRDDCKLTFQRSTLRRTRTRIAATRMIARCARSPSSPAPAARRCAASGLDRSARPSKSAIRAANDLTTMRQSRAVMHFYSGRLMQFCSGVDTGGQNGGHRRRRHPCDTPAG